MIDAAFWNGRRVLVTGHTGFKGSWLCLWLHARGAQISGFALPPATDPNLFSLLDLERAIDSRFVDARDRDAVAATIRDVRPEIVFHMAAQSLVRRGVANPHETFEANVLGLVSVLDAARATPEPPAIVVVTSDKVYADTARERAFREEDPLGGEDPYSASKACAEMVASAYATSYGMSLCTARAGNVIGGGDWSQGRLIPDLVRAIARNETPVLRDPYATRPWQHVLDALAGYMMLAERLIADPASARGAWNFGPDEAEPVTVAAVAERFLRSAGASSTAWKRSQEDEPPERPALRVDSSKARDRLRWRPHCDVNTAIDLTADWYRQVAQGEPALDESLSLLVHFE